MGSDPGDDGVRTDDLEVLEGTAHAGVEQLAEPLWVLFGIDHQDDPVDLEALDPVDGLADGALLPALPVDEPEAPAEQVAGGRGGGEDSVRVVARGDRLASRGV